MMTLFKFKFLPFIIILILLIVGTILIFFTNNNSINQTACTLEAKICPDGTAVGRTGPSCEFEKCPGE